MRGVLPTIAVFLLTLLAGCAGSTRIEGQVVDPQGRPVRPDRVWAVVDVPDEDCPPGEMRAKIVPVGLPHTDQEGRFDYEIEGQRPRLSFRKAGWRELGSADIQA